MTVCVVVLLSWSFTVQQGADDFLMSNGSSSSPCHFTQIGLKAAGDEGRVKDQVWLCGWYRAVGFLHSSGEFLVVGVVSV